MTKHYIFEYSLKRIDTDSFGQFIRKATLGQASCEVKAEDIPKIVTFMVENEYHELKER